MNTKLIYTLLLVTAIAYTLLNICHANTNKDSISQYRKQYTELVSQWQTNATNRIVIKQQIEQLKATNLFLFK